jgi:hypothetical protein
MNGATVIACIAGLSSVIPQWFGQTAIGPDQRQKSQRAGASECLRNPPTYQENAAKLLGLAYSRLRELRFAGQLPVPFFVCGDVAFYPRRNVSFRHPPE